MEANNMKLLFYVNNQSLSLNPTQQNLEIVADSKNYLVAKFIFQTNDWNNDRPKYALFSHNGKTYKKYLGVEDGLKADECYVAPEVIKAGNFTVSVFCEDYITTHTVSIPVKESGYTENIVNQPATPQALEQMNTLMYKYASLCNEILKECQRVQREIEQGGTK
jgi:hypothetical protein